MNTQYKKRTCSNDHLAVVIDQMNKNTKAVDKIRKGGAMMLIKHLGFSMYEAEYIYRTVAKKDVASLEEFDSLIKG